MSELREVGTPLMSRSLRPLSTLEPRDLKGSRLFCLGLTSGGAGQAAARLASLVGDHARVPADAVIMPKGFLRPEEAQIGRTQHFVDEAVSVRLREFWLSSGNTAARLPTWDLAATCEIQGKRGLILVEAKAHTQELDDRGKRFDGYSDAANHHSIGAAIHAANVDLNRRIPQWNLARDHHYQLSNRFAWAWKLADLGVPVVLVFLGILDAQEMDRGERRSFATHAEWQTTMANHTAGVVPSEAWDKRISVGAANVLPLIRSIRAQFVVDL